MTKKTIMASARLRRKRFVGLTAEVDGDLQIFGTMGLVVSDNHDIGAPKLGSGLCTSM